jgi:hypothetical protein
VGKSHGRHFQLRKSGGFYIEDLFLHRCFAGYDDFGCFTPQLSDLNLECGWFVFGSPCFAEENQVGMGHNQLQPIINHP